MIFEIIRGGGKTDWVGKEWAGLYFPRGKNGPAHSFPGEKTDWGEISACYNGSIIKKEETQLHNSTSNSQYIFAINGCSSIVGRYLYQQKTKLD